MLQEALRKRVTLVGAYSDSDEVRILKESGFDVEIIDSTPHNQHVYRASGSLRKTGIDIIGDMPWSTHFCQFYKTKQDLIDILVPYIKAGLENNEFCMWVTADNLDVNEAKQALREAIPDFDYYLNNGAIVILPYTEWYLDDGKFDRHKVLDSWVAKLNEALAMGYDGARVTGDTMWLNKSYWCDFTEYEESINSVIVDCPLLVLCTYSLDKCGASEIADVVTNHEFAIMKRAGDWTVIESADYKQTKEALRNTLDQLEAAKEELECINDELQTSNHAFIQSNQRFSLLSHTANELLISANPQDVIQSLCTDVMELLDCQAFFNYLADAEKHCLHLNACAGISEEMRRQIEWLEYGTAVCGSVAQCGCRIIAEDIQTTYDPRTDLVKSIGIQAYACHPLLGYRGDVIGTLSFGSLTRTSFSDDDLALMNTVADQVANALERMRLHNESKQKAAEMESFISSMADGVCLFNEEGSVVLVNDAGRIILGCGPDQNLTDWIHANQRYSLDGIPLSVNDAPFQRALHGETIRDFRYKIVNLIGKEVPLSVSASPVPGSDGRIIGATYVFRDITETIEFEQQRKELYEREHHIAQVLQQAIIPPRVPENLFGCNIAVRYRPALREAEIGGDFYDVFELGDGIFGVLIGDIAGKGLPAAIRVASARHAIRSYAYLEPNPGKVLNLANDALCRDGGLDEVNMLTAIFAIVDMNTGTLSYAIAGHEPPIFLRLNGEDDELQYGGMPMGVIANIEFSQMNRSINPGDTIVMVTDGITEARSKATDMFGKGHMTELLNKNRTASPGEIASMILDTATAHAGGRLQDDAAIVALRYEG